MMKFPTFLILSIGVGGLLILLLSSEVAAGYQTATVLTPAIPNGEWVTLGPHSSREYTFSYNYHGADKPSEAVVLLDSYQTGTFSFEVIRDDNAASIGAGSVMSKFTQNAGDSSKLIWVGSMKETITLLVRVKNLQDLPNSYSLIVEGQDVSFLSDIQDTGRSSLNSTAGDKPDDEVPVANVVLGPAFSKTGIKKLQVPETPTPGSSPDLALVPEEEWMVLQPNESRWYTFAYDYDQHAGPSNVIIYLDTAVINALTFDVMTTNMKIFGTSTPRNTSDGVSWEDLRLIWASQTLISGQYFVELKNHSDQPARYRLAITGKDVS